jgi:hypothetical protein
MAAGESHDPGRMTFAVTLSAATKFRIGESIGTGKDMHGDPMSGRVVDIKEGSSIALIILEVDK